jgi:erythritol transport system ATP-binding protein
MTTSATPVMQAHEVSKVYGATQALRRMDFAVRPGSVTTVFGENGAGKSTLMKILAGIEAPTAGWIELDGQEIVFRSPRDAADRGIAIIHQELSLCPNLSIADNLFLARERCRGGVVLDRQVQNELAAQLLRRLEEPLNPAALVSDLRLGQQQVVEIARALLQEARILIMDEPTSALSASEVEVLFRVIRDLTANGVAVVYISHHLEEALEIADHVVVLRDGFLVAEAPAGDVDSEWVVSSMVGRDLEEFFPSSFDDTTGRNLLEIEELVVADELRPGRRVVDGVSLRVRAGEILGIYGLMGSGRTELLEALTGRLPIASGQVRLDGRPLARAGIAQRIDRGLTLVPEDRQRDGLVQSLSVGRNLTLSALRRFVTRGWTSPEREHEAVTRTMRDVTVKASGPDAPIGSLSGGNQQKVVLGKALLTEPRVLLLDEPTRGIDVGAKADIFEIMAEQARLGRAVVFVTSEVNEALNVPDRVVVMYRGRIVADVARGEIDQDQLKTLSEGRELRGAGAHGDHHRDRRFDPTSHDVGGARP